MPSTIHSPVQNPTRRPTVVPNPMFERYVQAELANVGHFRDTAALVMLYSGKRDGTLDAADRAAIRGVISKYAGKIDPEAMSLLRQSIGLEKKTDHSAYDAQLVRKYLGYVDGDGKVTGGEADYLLATARNIGGSKAVKSFLKGELTHHADVFDADAKAKISAFISGR